MINDTHTMTSIEGNKNRLVITTVITNLEDIPDYQRLMNAQCQLEHFYDYVDSGDHPEFSDKFNCVVNMLGKDKDLIDYVSAMFYKQNSLLADIRLRCNTLEKELNTKNEYIKQLEMQNNSFLSRFLHKKKKEK